MNTIKGGYMNKNAPEFCKKPRLYSQRSTSISSDSPKFKSYFLFYQQNAKLEYFRFAT